jgi:septal ring factor EnvC (AmiA/AmiB activator)
MMALPLRTLAASLVIGFVHVSDAIAQPAPRNAPSAKAVNAASGKDEMTPEAARKLLDQHQRKLEEIDSEKTAIARQVDLMAFERARLKSELIEKAQRIKETEKKLSEIEQQLFETAAKEQSQRRIFEERKTELVGILTILQRLSRQPPPVFVTEKGDVLSMVRSGIVLASVFKKIEPLARELQRDLTELETLSADLKRKSEQQKILIAELNRRRLEIEPALAAQREQMQASQARLKLLQEAASKHSAAMQSLSEVIAALDREVARQSTLGDYEMELQTAVAVELKPEAKKLAFVQPGRLKPSVPFSQTKGLLPSPAEGILVRNFGDPDSYGGTSQGIAIETRDKAQVTAPCDGWVVYADNLKNYGQVLIINAGGGYHILLAGMDRIQASLGQFVLAGEPIAIMGSRKNPDETGGTAKKPILYIEFRKNQKPVDPSPWWSSRADVEKG